MDREGGGGGGGSHVSVPLSLTLFLFSYVPIPLFLSFNPCPSISAISVPLSPLSLTLSLCPRLIHSVLASLSLLLCSCPCPSLALYYNLYTLLYIANADKFQRWWTHFLPMHVTGRQFQFNTNCHHYSKLNSSARLDPLFY